MISQRLHRHLPDLGLHIESGGTQTSHTEGACVSGLQTPTTPQDARSSWVPLTPRQCRRSEKQDRGRPWCAGSLSPRSPHEELHHGFPRQRPAPRNKSRRWSPSSQIAPSNSALTRSTSSWWRTNPLTSGPTDFPYHLSPDSKPRPTANGGSPTQAPRRHSTHATESRAGGLPHEPTGRRPTNPQPTTQPLR